MMNQETELRRKTLLLLQGTLKHARVAALAVALVPLASVVAVNPAQAQEQCDTSNPPVCIGRPEDGVDGTPVSVPEPGTLVLMGSGLAGLAAAVRRLRK